MELNNINNISNNNKKLKIDSNKLLELLTRLESSSLQEYFILCKELELYY